MPVRHSTGLGAAAASAATERSTGERPPPPGVPPTGPQNPLSDQRQQISDFLDLVLTELLTRIIHGGAVKGLVSVD